MRLNSLLPRVLRRIRDKGLLETIGRMSFLAQEMYWERRLGVDTVGCLPREFVSEDPACVGYDPIGYRQLGEALRHANLRRPTGTFLDYGCGKGRVLARAATLPFDQIIGVETSTSLCSDARSNIERLSRFVRCKNISVVNGNAKTYVVPDDTKNIFLFNPFIGHILEGVTIQIQRSLERNPRELTILYVLPVESSDIFARKNWMKIAYHHSWGGIKLHVHHSVPSKL
ncbi:MAG: class I SAM-dependent methyltransferase [Planctomycetaceae bacterium]|nr:class I SAM-dependent methyltransferase [Planctomycetaceae bacterium]